MTDSTDSRMTIHVDRIRDTVSRLCIEANRYLPADLRTALSQARHEERSETGREILGQLCANADLARETGLPICQDTGMAVVFLSIGLEVRLVGGDLRAAVDAGVADGYLRGHRRASVVREPLRRITPGDPTPAVLHSASIPGTHLRITVVPKASEVKT
jgi:fumarate hydratase subunit alpha